MGSSRGSGRLLAWILLTITTYGFDLICLTALMPTIRDDLGGDELYGAVFSVFMLGSIVSLVVAGHLSDRLGPVFPGAISPALLAAGLVGVALAPSMEMVVLARALSGLGGGGILSTAYVAAGRGFPPERRASLFAIIGSGWTIPSLIGPWAADAVEATWGWRWMFVLLVPCALLAAVLAPPIVSGLSKPETDPGPLRNVGPAIILASSASLVLLGSGPSAEPIGAWRYLPVTLCAVIGFMALRRLLPDGTLSARRGLPAAVASRGLLAMAFMTTNSFLPLALVEFLDASVAGAGIVLTVAAVSWTAGAFLQAHLSRAWTPRATARMGLILVCAGIVASAAAIRADLSILFAYGTWGLGSIGMGLTYNTLSVYALDVAPTGGEGRTAASLQLADPIGTAVGTGVGGVIVATSLGFVGLWAMMAAVTVVGFAAASGLAQTEPSATPLR